MKSPYDSILIDAERKLVRHWTIFASVAYGAIAVGLLALVVTGNASQDDADNPLGSMSFYDVDGLGSPVFQPNRLSQLLPNSTESTNGLNNAPAPAAPANTALSAVPSTPEVDELAEIAAAQTGGSGGPSPQEALVENGWDFTAPNGVPGFGSLPQAGATPSAGVPQQTAQTQK